MLSLSGEQAAAVTRVRWSRSVADRKRSSWAYAFNPQDYDDSLNDALHPPLAPISSLSPHHLPYRQLRSHASKAARNGEQQVLPSRDTKVSYEQPQQQQSQALSVVQVPQHPQYKSRGTVHYQVGSDVGISPRGHL